MSANPAPQAKHHKLVEALRQAHQCEQAGQAALAIAKYEEVLASGANAVGVYNRMFALKGFHIGNSAAANDKLFHEEALPALLRCLETGQYDQALELESLIYNSYVKQIESEEHYDHCFRQWAAPMERAGVAFAQSLPPLKLPPAAGPLRVGFFFHNATVLAHTEVILSYLEGLHGLEKKPVEPHIYVFQSPKNQHDPAFDARFAAVGAQVHYLFDSLGPNDNLPTRRLLALRQLAKTHRISLMTWVSIPLYLAFASAMQVAPLHAWYALRFHPNCFSHVDGYIGGGSLFNETGVIRGRTWRTAFIAYKDLYDPALEKDAAAIRRRFKGKTILGTVSRPEKLMGEDFLGALQAIMTANPRAVFLWTAHKNKDDYPPFAGALEARGIAERCHCIGWVDPKLYVQVFDIYLDSFPSVSGMTAVQAMAAGTPVVSVIEDSMLGAYAYPFIRKTQGTPEQQQAMSVLFQDDTYLTCATTPDGYVALAQQLIDQPDFRHKTGQAQQQFAQRYLCDREGLARRLNRHFTDIVEEKRKGTA